MQAGFQLSNQFYDVVQIGSCVIFFCDILGCFVTGYATDKTQDNVEQSLLQLDVFTNEFFITEDLLAGMYVLTEGRITQNPNTQFGIANNIFNGDDNFGQRGIYIDGDNDDVVGMSALNISSNLFQLGASIGNLVNGNIGGQADIFLEFEHTLDLRIEDHQSTPGSIGTGGGFSTTDTDHDNIFLSLGAINNAVTIEDNTFLINEDGFDRNTMINVDRIGAGSEFLIQRNTTNFLTGFGQGDVADDLVLRFGTVNRNRLDPTTRIRLLTGDDNPVLSASGLFPINNAIFGIIDDFTGSVLINQGANP